MLLLPATLINKCFSPEHEEFDACASILNPLTNWLQMLLVVYLVKPYYTVPLVCPFLCACIALALNFIVFHCIAWHWKAVVHFISFHCICSMMLGPEIHQIMIMVLIFPSLGFLCTAGSIHLWKSSEGESRSWRCNLHWGKQWSSEGTIHVQNF